VLPDPPASRQNTPIISTRKSPVNIGILKLFQLELDCILSKLTAQKPAHTIIFDFSLATVDSFSTVPRSGYTILVISDIHYASDPELARGPDHELDGISSASKRKLLGLIRRHVWIGNPFLSRTLLKQILSQPLECDLVVALGDYGLDPEYMGVADPIVYSNVSECLNLLRSHFGEKFVGLIGDHELGKRNVTGEIGCMNLKSWHISVTDLGLKPFWVLRISPWIFIGITSSLIALPNLMGDVIRTELPEWENLRKKHVDQIRQAFINAPSDHKIILFCHDPTALGFLWEDDIVRARLPNVALTIVGHLHSRAILTQSKILAGIPPLKFLGHTINRYSHALHLAKRWWDFKVNICPAPFGLKLLRDGGYLIVKLPFDPHLHPQIHQVKLFHQ